MNIYFILLLVFLVGNYLLDLVARICNLRTLSPEPPAEFRELLDAEKYRRSQEYIRECSRFGNWRNSVNLAATLAFLLLGGFPWADRAARAAGGGMIVTGLLFLGICALLSQAVDLPFTVWDTFRIEQKYGFNRTTWRTFVLDQLKGLLLGAVIGGPMAAAVIWFFVAVGPSAWLYAWGAVLAFQLVILFVAPVLIMPLFNKYTPLPESELKSALETYIHAQRFKMRGLFTMDGSRRSTHSNAFFTGFGRFRRIVLFDTLIQKHTVPELLTVVAHEMGHYKKRHILYGMLQSVAVTGLIFALLPLFLYNGALAAAFGMPHATVYAGLVFFGFLFTPISVFLSIFANAVSRRCEYQADAYAVETTGQPEAMIAALQKLNVDNYAHLTPHPFVVALRYSHPPILERIRAIRHLSGRAISV
jgi:STE24 endopeptidase